MTVANFGLSICLWTDQGETSHSPLQRTATDSLIYTYYCAQLLYLWCSSLSVEVGTYDISRNISDVHSAVVYSYMTTSQFEYIVYRYASEVF